MGHELETARRVSLSSAVSEVAAALSGTPGPLRREELQILDTFDGRFASRHLRLTRVLDDGVAHLCLSEPGEPSPPVVQVVAGDPPFLLADLPAGPVRDAIAEDLSIRALLPRLVARVRSRTVDGVTDGLRVTVSERVVAEPGDARRVRLVPRVSLHAARAEGEGALPAAIDALCRRGLRVTHVDWVDAAFDTLGVPRTGPELELEIELDPDTRADLAVKRALHRALAVMRLQERGLLASWDTEFLHDYRVAVRRARSILGDVRGVLPSTVAKRFARELRWVGALTSAPRDDDVLLLSLSDYVEGLAPADDARVRRLLEALSASRQGGLLELARALRSPRYARFVARYAAFLAAPPAKRPSARRALAPIAQVSRRATWRAYRRLVRRGDAIEASSPAAALHELRKDAKKLRYLLETFRTLYPPAQHERVVRDLKRVQTVLGAFQDLEVHARMLRDEAAALEVEADPTSLEAAALARAVSDTLAVRQAEARARFGDVWSELRSTAAHRRVKELCGRGAG